MTEPTSGPLLCIRLPAWFRSCRWTISMAARTGLRSVIALWLIEAQLASEGRQTRKHGLRNLLRDKGLAFTPRQASALFFLYTTRQLVCVVSQYQCAGSPSFRICNKCRVVVLSFTQGYHS